VKPKEAKDPKGGQYVNFERGEKYIGNRTGSAANLENLPDGTRAERIQGGEKGSFWHDNQRRIETTSRESSRENGCGLDLLEEKGNDIRS